VIAGLISEFLASSGAPARGPAGGLR
jgi:hypothetical protein